MDTSETNIKMCDCPEIQEVWRPSSGDLYYEHIDGKPKAEWTDSDRAELLVHRIIGSDDEQNLCSLNIIKHIKARAIWLPCQDDLQEISGFQWNDFDEECLKVDEVFNGELPSKEQAGIMVVMKEKYQKVWDGKIWA